MVISLKNRTFHDVINRAQLEHFLQDLLPAEPISGDDELPPDLPRGVPLRQQDRQLHGRMRNQWVGFKRHPVARNLSLA